MKRPSAKAATSALFGLMADARSSAYDRGFFKTQKLAGATVVSVGNLRAGGTGKTPTAIMLAEMLLKTGRRPAVLLRGYKGTMELHGGLVSKGDGPLVDADTAGDEAFEVAARTRNIPVRVGAKRYDQALKAVQAGADVVILDDGFQHRRLARDLDLVMICPEDLNPSTRRLPFGPLRESAAALHRAHLTGGLRSDWEGHLVPPDILLEQVPDRLLDERHNEVSIDSLGETFLFCGIERPQRFEESAAAKGVRKVGSYAFKDHHRFSKADLRRIQDRALVAGARSLLTTEKDLARLGTAGSFFDLPLRALRIRCEILSGKERLLEEISRRL